MRWRSAWKVAIGTPNCLRVFMYSTVMRDQLVHRADGLGAERGDADVDGRARAPARPRRQEQLDGGGVRQHQVGGAAPSCVP